MLPGYSRLKGRDRAGELEEKKKRRKLVEGRGILYTSGHGQMEVG
jgi:hypothetical protein